MRTILTSLDDLKAEDLVSIDLHGKTTLADVMIIATGRSNVHVGALADRVIKAFKEYYHTAPRAEGLQTCDWVLIDAGDIIVHVFRPEVRQFYNLEKMWGVDRPGEFARRLSSAPCVFSWLALAVQKPALSVNLLTATLSAPARQGEPSALRT